MGLFHAPEPFAQPSGEMIGLLIVTFYFFSTFEAQNDLQLQSVVFLTRHGARTPYIFPGKLSSIFFF